MEFFLLPLNTRRGGRIFPVAVTVITAVAHFVSFVDLCTCNRNMSKSKGWTLQSSLLMLWMEKTRVNNKTKIDDDGNLLKTL